MWNTVCDVLDRNNYFKSLHFCNMHLRSESLLSEASWLKTVRFILLRCPQPGFEPGTLDNPQQYIRYSH